MYDLEINVCLQSTFSFIFPDISEVLELQEDYELPEKYKTEIEVVISYWRKEDGSYGSEAYIRSAETSTVLFLADLMTITKREISELNTFKFDEEMQSLLIAKYTESYNFYESITLLLEKYYRYWDLPFDTDDEDEDMSVEQLENH